MRSSKSEGKPGRRDGLRPAGKRRHCCRRGVRPGDRGQGYRRHCGFCQGPRRGLRRSGARRSPGPGLWTDSTRPASPASAQKPRPPVLRPVKFCQKPHAEITTSPPPGTWSLTTRQGHWHTCGRFRRSLWWSRPTAWPWAKGRAYCPKSFGGRSCCQDHDGGPGLWRLRQGDCH